MGNNANNGATFQAPLDGSSMQTGTASFVLLGATQHMSTSYGFNALFQHTDAGTNNTALGAYAGSAVTFRQL